MSRHGIHALPVVNTANHLIGIVTTTDIMAGLLRRLREIDGGDAHSRVETAATDPTRAVAAAHGAVASGTDRDGVAALALTLYHRNALLEALRKDVARYLSYGQDAQLHARLLQDLDMLEREAPRHPDL